MISLALFHVRASDGAGASRMLRDAGVPAAEDRWGSGRDWTDHAVFAVPADRTADAATALRELRR